MTNLARSPARPRKKLRHRKCIIDGIKGVTVPGDAGDGPWRLEHRSGVRIEKDNEEDVGSTDGEEEAANDKFNMLRAQQETTHAAIAQGALAAVLKTFVLSPEDLRRKSRGPGGRSLLGDGRPGNQRALQIDQNAGSSSARSRPTTTVTTGSASQRSPPDARSRRGKGLGGNGVQRRPSRLPQKAVERAWRTSL